MNMFVKAAATNAAQVNKIAVLMSGGVDSSVAALLCLKKGYNVIGITMQITDDITPVKKAAAVCEKIDIEHYSIDLREAFRENVLNYFKESYENGKTPNPCVICNEMVKFGEMFKFAKELGAGYIATGHYAKISFDNESVQLEKSADLKKDQSYFLSRVSPEILKYTIFPLENHSKDEVREIAHEFDLPPKSDKDSQDICFLTNTDYKEFLTQNFSFNTKTGNFINEEGKIIGRHSGIHNYTIGQRKGLGAFGQPMIVKHIDNLTGNITLCTAGNEFFHSVTINNIKFFGAYQKFKNEKLHVKTRYSQNEIDVSSMQFHENICKIEFEEPVRAVTPGQFVVCYHQNYVLFNGEIVKNI